MTCNQTEYNLGKIAVGRPTRVRFSTKYSADTYRSKLNYLWLRPLVNTVIRASKSPDFAGDLPIFDKIMKISRFGMQISRFITRDSSLSLSIASFAIAVGETFFGFYRN